MTKISKIKRQDNLITIEGPFHLKSLSYLLSNVHQATIRAGYDEVILDFSLCTSAYPDSMLGVCAQLLKLRETCGINTKLEIPESTELKSLFINTNWAYILDPRRYDEGKKNLYTTHVPAIQYRNSMDQHNIINRIMGVLLGCVTDLDRKDLAAFEWSISEITDNVLTHSESDIGGIVQLSVFKAKKSVQYVVADAGMGIPKSMRSGEYPKLSDLDALDYCIREGVTRDKKIGQGNGLFGSYSVSHLSKGSFHIRSGNGRLNYSDKLGLHVSNDIVPNEGTLVAGEVSFSDSGILAKALKFRGKEHQLSYDSIAQHYESSSDGLLVFHLKNEADSFGSRPSGTVVRNKIKNLLIMNSGSKIRIDFEGVPLMSSSFADEVFGKLFKEIGPIDFMGRVILDGVTDISKDLVNKAIYQRMKDAA